MFLAPILSQIDLKLVTLFSQNSFLFFGLNRNDATLFFALDTCFQRISLHLRLSFKLWTHQRMQRNNFFGNNFKKHIEFVFFKNKSYKGTTWNKSFFQNKSDKGAKQTKAFVPLCSFVTFVLKKNFCATLPPL